MSEQLPFSRRLSYRCFHSFLASFAAPCDHPLGPSVDWSSPSEVWILVVQPPFDEGKSTVVAAVDILGSPASYLNEGHTVSLPVPLAKRHVRVLCNGLNHGLGQR